MSFIGTDPAAGWYIPSMDFMDGYSHPRAVQFRTEIGHQFQNSQMMIMVILQIMVITK